MAQPVPYYNFAHNNGSFLMKRCKSQSTAFDHDFKRLYVADFDVLNLSKVSPPTKYNSLDFRVSRFIVLTLETSFFRKEMWGLGEVGDSK